MKKINQLKVGVCSSSFSNNEILKRELCALFQNISFNNSGERLAGAELVNFLEDCELAIVALEKFDQQSISQLPNLRHISKYGVGLDNIDLNALKAGKVTLSWRGGVNKRSVSELVLFFFLALIRHSFNSSNLLKNGTWHKGAGNLLSGKKVGIIGLGFVGLDLSNLLQPFGCEIWGNDILPKESFKAHGHIRLCTKEEIFKECDLISLHTPLNNETKHLLNRETFSLMKKGAYVINTARGGLINEEDLIQALDDSIIAGAGLDVFHGEPNVSPLLYRHDKVICTPHIGGSAEEAILAMGRSAIDGLLKPNFEL